MTEINAILSFGILFVLALVSHQFNRHIDKHPARADGTTARRVVGGVLYTLAGSLGLMTIWVGWEAAAACGGITLVAFIASGAPMYFGDVDRSSRERG